MLGERREGGRLEGIAVVLSREIELRRRRTTARRAATAFPLSFSADSPFPAV
jgi:hypothetical protein